MKVISVPDSEMPVGHDWLVVELGQDVLAFVAESTGWLEASASLARIA